jgi:hypothetical protein
MNTVDVWEVKRDENRWQLVGITPTVYVDSELLKQHYRLADLGYLEFPIIGATIKRIEKGYYIIEKGDSIVFMCMGYYASMGSVEGGQWLEVRDSRSGGCLVEIEKGKEEFFITYEIRDHKYKVKIGIEYNQPIATKQE